MSSSTQRSPREPPPRPISRNPFLDSPPTTNQTLSPEEMAFPRTSPTTQVPALTGNAADLFVRLLQHMNTLPLLVLNGHEVLWIEAYMLWGNSTETRST